MFSDVTAFITEIERRGELARIADALDPKLEIAAVIDRVSKSPGGGPALLFERPAGSTSLTAGATMPVAANLYGSMSRICLALGVQHLDELAREIDDLITPPMPRGFMDALKMMPLVSRLTGERAAPTFSYLRVYDPGAVLRPHRDRPSCRWNVDLVLGGEPSPNRQNAWPLRVEGRRGVRSLRLGLGDGVLYRGERVRHWRREQPRGRTTVLAALHYGRPGRHSSSAS